MIRSVVLFVHVVGMLVLFVGMAFEWLSLASLRRSTTPEHATPWVRLQEMLPRAYAIAFATLLVTGMMLARGLGLFQSAWLRLALAMMLVMGILGGRAGRSRVRAMRDALRQGGEIGLEALHRCASQSWPRVSLFLRATIGLAVVYLMIGKPRLTASLVVTGVAVATGLTIGLFSTATDRRPSDS
jgi:hypothetical protein